MYSFILTVLRVLPWWGYGLLAFLFGSLTLGAYEDYSDTQADYRAAIAAGAPPVTKIDQFDGRRGVGPMSEVQIAGVLRADLGLGQLDGSVPKSYLVLDSPDRRGPLVALMFVGSDAQDSLMTVVRSADAENRVIVSGTLRTLDRAAVRGQLFLRGVTRDLYLVEAFPAGRAEALEAKANADLPFVGLLAALSAICALVALWRLNRWRSRVRARRPATPGRPTPSQATPAPSPAPRPAPNTPPTPSPWGQFKPTTRRANPTSPPDLAQGIPAAQPARRRPPPAATDEEPPTQQPEFESVFPGGGSGFRFKSADEIIRETFGTVSRLGTMDGRQPD